MRRALDAAPELLLRGEQKVEGIGRNRDLDAFPPVKIESAAVLALITHILC